MSRVLYADAEEVAKPAFRELLLEAAKDHMRARFGDTIARLAHMAVDELLIDIEASLEIEDRIQRRRDSSGMEERVRAALAQTASERGAPSADRTRVRRPGARKGRR